MAYSDLTKFEQGLIAEREAYLAARELKRLEKREKYLVKQRKRYPKPEVARPDNHTYKVRMSVRDGYQGPIKEFEHIAHTMSRLLAETEARKIARQQKLVPWCLLETVRVE